MVLEYKINQNLLISYTIIANSGQDVKVFPKDPEIGEISCTLTNSYQYRNLRIIGTFTVSGTGIMIGSCALDCDTGYWECVIVKEPEGCKVGIKKYTKSEQLTGLLKEEETAWLFDAAKHPLREGDVVGVYWDQTALPMLSFTVNGVQDPSISINRVRPAVDVYPACSVTGNSIVDMSFNSSNFKFPPTSKKFSMIICASQLI